MLIFSHSSAALMNADHSWDMRAPAPSGTQPRSQTKLLRVLLPKILVWGPDLTLHGPLGGVSITAFPVCNISSESYWRLYGNLHVLSNSPLCNNLFVPHLLPRTRVICWSSKPLCTAVLLDCSPSSLQPQLLVIPCGPNSPSPSSCHDATLSYSQNSN